MYRNRTGAEKVGNAILFLTGRQCGLNDACSEECRSSLVDRTYA